MIDHFIYDFDGTLSDSYPVFWRIFEELRARHGGVPNCSDDALRRRIKNAVIEGYRAIEWADGLTKEQFMQEFKALQEKHFADFETYPHTEELLRAVVESGKRNYIYTHSGKVVHKIMENMGIAQYFTFVLDASQGFPSKPAPDALLHLIERYHLDPKTCVMVGDRPIDVQAGEKAGMQSCFFDPDGFYPNTPATYHVDTLADIMKLI
ncbi:MAG: HAD-IA family hydrolase [Clostridia bacterium]|nr:HAD-IA family hydrolase [Clostridia bacterium]